jgi:hypothetical protein
MTITLGTWIYPLALTLCWFAAALWFIPKPEPSNGWFPDPTPAIVAVLNVLFAAILSLVAWLVWAVI